MNIDVIGGGQVVPRSHEDEGPHPKSDHEWWQESVTLIWWDLDNHIGGFHRIGHEPNYKAGPHVCLTNSLFTKDEVYRRSEFIPMHKEDQIPNGFGGGNGHCTFQFVDGEAIWTLDDDDIAMRLTAQDHHMPIDIWPKSGELGKDVAPEHMEVSSDITGTLTFNGKHYNVNGVAFRDHGWGIRIWDKIMVYRWVVGIFDDTLSVFAMTFLSPDGTLSKFGIVNRDGQLIRAEDVDITTYIEADGFTHRGGHVTITLATGEVMEMECEILQKGTVNSHHGNTWLDTFCKLTYGDRVGVCDFEIANRPFQGTTPPVLLEKAIMKNGIFKASV
jgi:hypothetical protein